jgi:hypothetical protein
VKILLPLLGLLALVACNRGIQNKDAVRQGVLDYLANRPGLSMGGMKVDVTNVTFKDGKAEAEVSFAAKGGPGGGGMTMRYTLEQKDNKWVVVGKADSGKGPHSGGAMPGMPGGDAAPGGMTNPHGGGGMVDTERPGGMPPGHPPTGKKPDSEKK